MGGHRPRLVNRTESKFYLAERLKRLPWVCGADWRIPPITQTEWWIEGLPAVGRSQRGRQMLLDPTVLWVAGRPSGILPITDRSPVFIGPFANNSPSH